MIIRPGPTLTFLEDFLKCTKILDETYNQMEPLCRTASSNSELSVSKCFYKWIFQYKSFESLVQHKLTSPCFLLKSLIKFGPEYFSMFWRSDFSSRNHMSHVFIIFLHITKGLLIFLVIWNRSLYFILKSKSLTHKFNFFARLTFFNWFFLNIGLERVGLDNDRLA